jgi:hypothetical protein
MYCPQCGVRSEQTTKFCKTCGCRFDPPALPFAAPREIVPGPINREEAMRQLRWLKGTRALLIGTAFLPLSFFAAALSAASNGGDAEAFAVVACLLLAGALCTSGWGIIHLLRGGFFKTYKERRIRAEAVLLGQPIPLPQASFEPPPETNRLAARNEATSITEPTTRTLRPMAGDAGKAN